MSLENGQFIIPLLFLVSLIYSTVGHGGASAYILILTLFNFNTDFISTSALILNIAVSSVAFLNFKRRGYFDTDHLLPFIITSIPLAFLGGSIKVSKNVFSILVGITILFSAVRLTLQFSENIDYKNKVPFLPATLLGAIIGFVSGIIGVGGGIFLSPIVILLKWLEPKKTSGIAALFIVINSACALIARLVKFNQTLPDPSLLFLLILITLCGGYVGSYVASSKFKISTIQKALAIILVIGGFKLIMDSVK